MNCVGTLTGTNCTWQRKLCVTCRIKNKITYIRVQSNGLPNHCYTTVTSTKMLSLTIDYEVAFNLNVTSLAL